MRISFAVFADAANVSQEGKLNVMGIFDALHVSGFPSMHPRAHFVLRLKGNRNDAGRHVLTFRWVNPNGAELWQSTGELQLDSAHPATLDTEFEVDLPVIAVVDLPLDAGGHYVMHVELDTRPVTQIPLFVSGPAASIPSVGLVS